MVHGRCRGIALVFPVVLKPFVVMHNSQLSSNSERVLFLSPLPSSMSQYGEDLARPHDDDPQRRYGPA